MTTFTSFSVSPQRCRRNYLAGRLEPEDLEFIFGKKFTEAGYVGLSTLAMGDLNACEFAQGSHIKLVMSCGGAAMEEILMMHQPSPRGLLSVGVVIDDLVCLEKVLASDVKKWCIYGCFSFGRADGADHGQVRRGLGCLLTRRRPSTTV